MIAARLQTPTTPANLIIDLDADPFIPSGLTVVEHQRGGQLTWDASEIALYLSKHQQGNSHIQGDELRDELKGKPVYNANLLDYLLEHPHLIPEEWQGKHVFFWGTLYCDAGGLFLVRYLYKGSRKWRWSGHWLDCCWPSNCPAAVLAS